MKKQYWIALFVIGVFISLGSYYFLNTKIDYTDFASARYQPRKVQVNGVKTNDKCESYNPKTNIFTFTMRDHSNNIAKIVFNGPKPMNFDIAEAFVVEGKFVDSVFYASRILTKCPSKYEGRAGEL